MYLQIYCIFLLQIKTLKVYETRTFQGPNFNGFHTILMQVIWIEWKNFKILCYWNIFNLNIYPHFLNCNIIFSFSFKKMKQISIRETCLLLKKYLICYVFWQIHNNIRCYEIFRDRAFSVRALCGAMLINQSNFRSR